MLKGLSCNIYFISINSWKPYALQCIWGAFLARKCCCVTGVKWHSWNKYSKQSLLVSLLSLSKWNRVPTFGCVDDSYVIIHPVLHVFLTGGKWTTYRHMAEETVDKAISVCGLCAPKPVSTIGLLLDGAHGWTPTLFIRLVQDFGLENEVCSCSNIFKLEFIQRNITDLAPRTTLLTCFYFDFLWFVCHLHLNVKLLLKVIIEKLILIEIWEVIGWNENFFF